MAPLPLKPKIPDLPPAVEAKQPRKAEASAAPAKAPPEFEELATGEAADALDAIFNDAASELGPEWKMDTAKREKFGKRIARALNDWAKTSAAGRVTAAAFQRLNLIILFLTLGAFLLSASVRMLKRMATEKKNSAESFGKALATDTKSEYPRAVDA